MVCAVAFTVDPLFHQMSAQFDEDDIECVMNSLLKVTEISPTLKEILKMLDDPYRAAVEDEAYSGSPGRCETDFPWQENHGAFSGDDGDEISTIDSHSGFNDYEEGRGSLEGFQDVVNSTPQMGSWREVTPDLVDFEGDLGDSEVEDSRVGDIMRHGSVEWLTASFGQSTQANAWAGPDHWKYHKPRACHRTSMDDCRRKKRQHFLLDFENPLELDMSKFEPPENRNSTLLVHHGGSCSSLLPPDLHYEALNLVTLFLKPTVQVKRFKGSPDTSFFQFAVPWKVGQTKVRYNIYDPYLAQCTRIIFHAFCIIFPFCRFGDKARPKRHCAEDYDMDSGNDERAPLSDSCWPEENDHGKLHNLFENDLINAPRKGEEFSQDEGGISIQDLLDFLPEDCPAAAQEDNSVHICFLCLLHLANEHNLCIKDCSTMDELQIFQVDKHAALASDVGDG
ncbi:hypothetical protein BDL97_08G144500 [Sphagnum fallax]|nr:hypothetical protein BDL97_08G144500 [Sphagnum fallax]